MPQANDAAAALLEEYADLLVMTGGDPFRARVYTKAARAIAGHPAGRGRAAARRAAADTRCRQVDRGEGRRDRPDRRASPSLRNCGPTSPRACGSSPGSRRSARAVRCSSTGSCTISSPDQLATAIARRPAQQPEGLRPEERGQAAARHRAAGNAGGRVLLNVAAETAAAVIDAVSAAPGCLRIGAAGSLRRAAESVGDVDVLAAAADVGAADGGAHRDAGGGRGHRVRADEDLDADRRRPAGGPARGLA